MDLRRQHAGVREFVALAVVVWVCGCKVVHTSPGETSADAALDTGVTVAPVPVSRVVFRIPSENEIDNAALLRSIRRGRALLEDTQDSLPRYVGNALQCISCHPNDGTLRNAMPWVGAYARYPQYRSRSAFPQTLEDRINDCFRRSLNGKPLPIAGRDMRDMVAYMAFLSNGYPVGSRVEGQGLPHIDSLPLNPPPGDTLRAKQVFAEKCVACHGPNGLGTELAPPLWGPRSFNVGAGMARLYQATAWIKHVMPQNAPGTLTLQQAYDLATLITSRPRPDLPGKELDWPNGNPPPDAAYPTRAAQRLGKGSSRTRAAATTGRRKG